MSASRHSNRETTAISPFGRSVSHAIPNKREPLFVLSFYEPRLLLSIAFHMRTRTIGNRSPAFFLAEKA